MKLVEANRFVLPDVFHQQWFRSRIVEILDFPDCFKDSTPIPPHKQTDNHQNAHRTEAQRERMMSEDGMMSNFQNEKATLTQQLEVGVVGPLRFLTILEKGSGGLLSLNKTNAGQDW